MKRDASSRSKSSQDASLSRLNWGYREAGLRSRPVWRVVFWSVAFLAGSCARFSPRPSTDQGFLARAMTEERGGMEVAAVALAADESRRYFGLDLAGKGIQPVWLEIRNRTDHPVWYLTVSTDPSYFAPGEVAYRFHTRLGGHVNRKIDSYFASSGVPDHVPAGGAASGATGLSRQVVRPTRRRRRQPRRRRRARRWSSRAARPT